MTTSSRPFFPLVKCSVRADAGEARREDGRGEEGGRKGRGGRKEGERREDLREGAEL